MPIIPAVPGDYTSLFMGVFRLYQDPSSWEATAQIEKGTIGYAAISLHHHLAAAEVTLTRDDLEYIAAGQPDRVPLKVKLKELLYGTTTAGHVLVYTLRLARHMPRLASAATAMRILEWRYTTPEWNWPASPTSIKTAWRKYRPIAQFVGAASFVPEEYKELTECFPLAIDASDESLDYLPADRDFAAKIIKDAAGVSQRLDRVHKVILPRYFAYAEALRRAGEAHFATGQDAHGHSLLDRETSWRVPEGFALPPVQLDLPLLSAEEMKAAAS